MKYMMRLRGADGSWTDVPAIAGRDGTSAYQAAQAGGYTGTEAALNGALAAVPGHIADKANPHGVTAAQVGAETAGAAAQALSDAKAYADQAVAAAITGAIRGSY